MLLSAGVSLVSHTDSGYYPLLLSARDRRAGRFPAHLRRPHRTAQQQGGLLYRRGFVDRGQRRGDVPYLMWGGEFSLVNAWFESVSGYTTTGASILKDVERCRAGCSSGGRVRRGWAVSAW